MEAARAGRYANEGETAMATSTNGPERTLGQLVADATADISTIVRSEIALAKAEITGEAKIAGKGAGLLGGAAFVGLLGHVEPGAVGGDEPVLPRPVEQRHRDVRGHGGLGGWSRC